MGQPDKQQECDQQDKVICGKGCLKILKQTPNYQQGKIGHKSQVCPEANVSVIVKDGRPVILQITASGEPYIGNVYSEQVGQSVAVIPHH